MKRIYIFEYLLYITVLLVALSAPFFGGIFDYKEWSDILKISVKVLPFVLIFLINNYILVPRLLFRDKYLYYLLFGILTVLSVVYLSGFLNDLTHPIPPPFDRMPLSDLPIHPEDMPHPPFFNFGQAIVSFLFIGFNAGVKGFIRWSNERELQSEKERQHLHTELAFLKSQISPHFFMNTLNNIHSLIDIDTEKARDAVVKLSRLMRYMLYEADVQKVSLKKEIDFIESYIELMRLRYDEDMLTIETGYPAVTEDIFVPSFLFLSFIENAFKHGVGLHAKSLIRIRFVSANGRLAFAVDNNKPGVVQAINETSGIGLENVQKRLNLIYKDDYTLDIRSGDDTYEINLNIPI